MRLLLDTQVVLWQLQGAWTVPAGAKQAIEGATELTFSVLSFGLGVADLPLHHRDRSTGS